MRSTTGIIAGFVAVLVAVVVLAGCGDGGTTATGAESGRARADQEQRPPAAGEDGDRPTRPARRATVATACPSGAAAPASAADALARTPAWAGLERERTDDVAGVARRARGTVTGTVVGVEQGGRGPSPSTRILGTDVPMTQMTASLVVAVDAVDDALAADVAPGDEVVVPLAVYDGGIDGLTDREVDVMHANASHALDCAVPRARVAVIVAATSAGRGTERPTLTLPALSWLPDPAAVILDDGERGIQSLDALVTDPEAFYRGATSPERVMMVAAPLTTG